MSQFAATGRFTVRDGYAAGGTRLRPETRLLPTSTPILVSTVSVDSRARKSNTTTTTTEVDAE
ncbi:hypothetical protein C481_18085 [Natrialba asiatica DSM 12278]|uniref:Uncharacterized protein n=1 Tax=Natrialba asiatica (strain ATCC 700177 / DSM 12278 / JCM 9576 / FERM P-10747 / NBRC 102637 / 172P1) TaxID=29540 RepID=M0AHL8_NATA1|nr:hypothetical protein C481_18085 [Natrialba asiatica DSM 12278]